MRVAIPEFKEKRELFDYLIENKTQLINTKRSMPITSDVCTLDISYIKNVGIKTKSVHEDDDEEEEDKDILRVKVVANTANWIDSHMDMLLPDAAKRSIEQRKGKIPHIHDHIHEITAKIGEVQDILLSQLSFAELGIKGTGQTQAIVFVTDVIKLYNEKVFNQYLLEKVNQHSIGLQYMKLTLAINDPDAKEEFAEWEKNFPNVINKEVAEKRGFFWPVQEFKLFENSTVLFGSNEITPTLETGIKSDPPKGTPQKQSPTGIDKEKFGKRNFLRNLAQK